MTKDTPPRQNLPFGLLELDSVGTVLYFKGDDEARGGGPPEVVGRNFFTEVAPAAHADELRKIIRGFWESHAPSRTLTLGGDSGRPCKILLARVHEQKDGWGQDSILVRFKKD